MMDADRDKNDQSATTVHRVYYTTEPVSNSDLDSMFKKLQTIKKASAISIFKKRVDPQEEEVLELFDKFISRVDELNFMLFLVANSNELEYFYALSFFPSNKNKRLAEQCQLVSLKIFALVNQLYVDITQGKRAFTLVGAVDKSAIKIDA